VEHHAEMGVQTDFANRDRLAELLRFESTKTEPGKYTTLARYVGKYERKSKGYLLSGRLLREALEKSPHLEIFRADNREVLLMTDPIDEWLADALGVYQEKQLKAAIKAK
jgi:molecular chaperone HtpG